MVLITKSIGAENTFATAAELAAGPFNFSLSGTWVATVHVQRSFDQGVTWLDVDSFTSNCELVGDNPEGGVYYRFGVKTGGYTSGTAVGRISQ